MVGCQTPECLQPVLLQKFGTCDSPGCLKEQESPITQGSPDASRFKCFGMRCLSQTYEYNRAYFRLVVQFENGVLSSADVQALPQDWSNKQSWRVVIAQNGLKLLPAEPPTSQSIFDRPAFALYLLTLVVELLVAGIYWRTLRSFIPLWKLLLMVAVATSLTFPVVFLAPSLRPFADAGDRNLFYIALATSLLGALVAWPFFIAVTNRQRIVRGILTLIAIFIAATLCGILGFGVLYSATNVFAAPGIPVPFGILLAELYAFGFEALALRFWGRGALNWREAFLLSMLANLASALLGLLLIF